MFSSVQSVRMYGSFTYVHIKCLYILVWRKKKSSAAIVIVQNMRKGKKLVCWVSDVLECQSVCVRANVFMCVYMNVECMCLDLLDCMCAYIRLSMFVLCLCERWPIVILWCRCVCEFERIDCDLIVRDQARGND